MWILTESQKPTHTIAWLGKELSSSPPSIRNSLDRVAHALITLFQFFASTYSRTRLRKILGLLQWLSRPAPDTAPFLASSYRLLRRLRQPRYFPLCMWSSLIQATLLCIRPAVPRPQPPPLTFAPIFVDAAAQTATRFRVGAVRPTHYMTSATAPTWIANQQTAEMYGLFHAVRQAALRRTSHLCLITDNAGAYFILTRGRTAADHPAQLRLLRRIWRLSYEHSIHLAVALTTSARNPADFPSRLHQFPLGRVICKAQDVHPLQVPFFRCTVIPRFWHRL